MKTKYRVLLVEDSIEVVRALSAILDDSYVSPVDFLVESVDSIADCIAAFNQKSYDVVVLDLNLRNGRGEATFLEIYNACNRNIGLPNEDRTPIVVLTGDSTVDYTAIVLKGAMDFICKPITSNNDFCRRLHMAILRFPYKRAQELHESIEKTIKEAREFLTGTGT